MKYLLLIALVVSLSLGLFVYIVRASDSGALSPGTMADDTAVGTIVWSTVDNAKVSDDATANAIVKNIGCANSISHYLKASNFGFSIPAGATIVGIVVEVEEKSLTNNCTP